MKTIKLSLLGIARKAGRLSCGFAATKEALQKGISSLVIIASDISEKSEKEIRYHSRGRVQVERVSATTFELTAAIGIKAGIVSVNDEGFAKALCSVTEAD